MTSDVIKVMFIDRDASYLISSHNSAFRLTAEINSMEHESVNWSLLHNTRPP